MIHGLFCTLAQIKSFHICFIVSNAQINLDRNNNKTYPQMNRDDGLIVLGPSFRIVNLVPVNLIFKSGKYEEN